MTTIINDRIDLLRSFMRINGLQAFIFPSTDPHQGEYIPDHWKTRAWISGFTGSAGTAVVTLDDAALWTDSRYFLAAEEELRNTPFMLMKDGLAETPSIVQWLIEKLAPGCVVGIDGSVCAFETYCVWSEQLSKHQIHIQTNLDPATSLWKNRPQLPLTPVQIHPLCYAGKSVVDKIADVRTCMKDKQCTYFILSALDEIAWTLNLRGKDIPCNPVFVSYLLISDSDTTLFIYKEKISPEVADHLKEANISVKDYQEVFSDLKSLNGSILLSLKGTNCAIVEAISSECHIVDSASPVSLMKAIKNQAEIEGFQAAMTRDGVAMVEFLKWLKPAVAEGKESELSIDRKLYDLRSKQAYFQDISFDTIAGYGPHGAIVHYEADETSNAPLKPEGLLLVDSGAQYLDGTTDITRTLALGPVTEEERRDYTLVLKGHIALSKAVFPTGTTGTQLDICARYAMWQEGINYLHGTGHGVGAYLNVHEGPHQIRMNYVPTPLQAGMTVTDEPGIYRTGKHGVRIENTLLVKPYKETEFGVFLCFEPLTLCPYDKEAILVELLDNHEIEWINRYHQEVYERLAPHLDEEHRLWLAEQTSPITK